MSFPNVLNRKISENNKPKIAVATTTAAAEPCEWKKNAQNLRPWTTTAYKKSLSKNNKKERR